MHSSQWPAEFKRLVWLVGEPTGTVVWDDGVGSEAIGRRRDLGSKRVLMCFQKKEAESYWLPIALGKKVRVDEGHSRPTLAIVGNRLNSKRS